MLYRRLKFSGGARVRFHTSIQFHFRSQTEVKRKTQLHALLNALRKIALFAQRSFAAYIFAAALKLFIPHGCRPNKKFKCRSANLFIYLFTAAPVREILPLKILIKILICNLLHLKFSLKISLMPILKIQIFMRTIKFIK